MKARAIRILVLLWLGWYLSGPAFETVDSWDTPKEEASDIFSSAGGIVTLVGVAVSLGIGLFRRLNDYCSAAARALCYDSPSFIAHPSAFLSFEIPATGHLPPVPLRI